MASMASQYSKTKKGFTVIEVMLFLAISGLMMIGIFAASKNGINNQRYSTAVTELQSYFQDQYSAVQNVRNDRPSNMTCVPGSVTVGGTSTSVGASQCSVVGRMIVANSSQQLVSYPIYATNDVSKLSAGCEDGSNNILSPSCTYAVVNTNDSNDYRLSWDTSMQWPGNGAAIGALSVAIYRSPANGQMAMQWSKQSTTNMAQFLAALDIGPVEMCVNRSGWTTIPTMGIMIDTTTIGSSNAVSRIAGGDGC
jgi:Tfp pilus assembly protein PilE